MLKLFLPRQLDAHRPLVREHPLLLGCVRAYVVAVGGHPSHSGGLTLMQLLGSAGQGALTNSPTWEGAYGAPSQWGTIRIDSQLEHINCGTTPVSGSAARTVLGLIRCDSFVASGAGILSLDDGTAAGSTGTRWSFKTDGTGALRIEVQGAGYTSSLSLTTGQWHFVACRLSGTTLAGHTIFRDTASEAATGTTTIATTSTHALRIGTHADFATTDRYLSGNVACMFLFDRALEDDTIRRWRQEILTGYPTLLRWTPRRFLSVPSATYSATAALQTGGTQCAASATFTAPVYSATAALTTDGTQFAASATHTTPTYNATADVTTGGTQFAASATFDAGTFTASADLTTGGTQFAADSSFATAIYLGSAALVTGGAQFAASATFTAPVYSADTPLNIGGTQFAASAQVTNPTYSADADLAVGGIQFAASATFGAVTYSATAAFTVGAVAFAASGTVVNPTYSATAALTIGGVQFAASNVVASLVARPGSATVEALVTAGEATIL